MGHTIDDGDAKPFRLPVRHGGITDRKIESHEIDKLVADGKLVHS